MVLLVVKVVMVHCPSSVWLHYVLSDYFNLDSVREFKFQLFLYVFIDFFVYTCIHIYCLVCVYLYMYLYLYVYTYLCIFIYVLY